MAPTRPEQHGLRRLVAAWGGLVAAQRQAAAASILLLAAMFLPWYSRTVNAVVGGQLRQQADGKLAITVFSFVEAAIFLVAVGVIVLLLARGDRRPFHLPGGDGTIVTIAGAWATFLIFYRFVDKPSGGSGSQVQIEYGLSWGIFFGLLAALALLASGLRLRAAQVAEPVIAGTVAPSDGPDGAPSGRPSATEPAEASPVPRARAAPAEGDAATRVAPAPGGDPEPAPDPEDGSREERRRQREERRAARPGVGTPVRERRPDPPPATITREDAPAGEAATRLVPPDEAATEVRPAPRPDSFEPPEFELPPRPRRAE